MPPTAAGYLPVAGQDRATIRLADQYRATILLGAKLALVTGWVLHVDLDQFLAAVEVLRRPELRGKPVVVGGDGDPAKRGVVSTASYEARRFGVHSGQALRTAARRCPDAVFLPVDKPAYDAVSAVVMATLKSFDVVLEVMGWDEAFIGAQTDDPVALAQEIQRAVREAASLDCSVGIGQNKLQAKIATGFGKPAGVFMITTETWFELLGHRPTDALWGIGSRTAHKLAALGIMTVADLAGAAPRDMAAQFGPMIGPWLVQTAHGIDLSPVTAEPYVPRGHGHEVTYQQNITDWEQVQTEVARIARKVADDIAADGRPAARVVVKVRYAPFFTHTHGRGLAEPTGDPEVIAAAALPALDDLTRRDPIRLLGVRAEFPPR
jgi:nucleotidyltransferase/DNA polymerase involved in DNA repair